MYLRLVMNLIKKENPIRLVSRVGHGAMGENISICIIYSKISQIPLPHFKILDLSIFKYNIKKYRWVRFWAASVKHHRGTLFGRYNLVLCICNIIR